MQLKVQWTFRTCSGQADNAESVALSVLDVDPRTSDLWTPRKSAEAVDQTRVRNRLRTTRKPSICLTRVSLIVASRCKDRLVAPRAAG